MHQKLCKIELTLGSFDFYLLLIDLHAYSEVFATEPIVLSIFILMLKFCKI